MLAKRYNVVQMRQFFSSKSCVRLLSLPMRGEWIEILSSAGGTPMIESLPMRGEWIEIIWPLSVLVILCSLSPCGESGLKYSLLKALGQVLQVSPHAGRVD